MRDRIVKTTAMAGICLFLLPGCAGPMSPFGAVNSWLKRTVADWSGESEMG
ncbi:MAG: hypothetical protein HC902_04315 [Calothrix sp. SM1_5_4]|nr:hypothetical protein [Calothrix sp. SM1_5_4]